MNKNHVILLVSGVCLLIPILSPSNVRANEAVPNAYETTPLYDSTQEQKKREEEEKYKPQFAKKEDFEDRILSKIPHGHKLKYLWNVADGDVDLYVEGLRFNRGNMGLDYKTSTLPMLGTVEGVTLKLKAGEKNEIAFESKIMPFVGELDGFTMKGSFSDHGRISARYTRSLDWGL